MSKRLDITLFGTLCKVGVIRLHKKAVAAGLKAYGPRKWDAMVTALALSADWKKKTQDIKHTIGHSIEFVFRAEGIVLQGNGFGMEVFHGGHFAPLEGVDATAQQVLPDKLLEGCDSQDMLGVFWGRKDGVMFFRWNDVEEIGQERPTLHYARIKSLLGKKGEFDLATDVTWLGTQGRRADPEDTGQFTHIQHVFHVKK